MKRLVVTVIALSLFFLGSAGAADIIKGRVDGTGDPKNVNVDSSGRVRTNATIGGTSPSTGAGVVDSGTQRVTLGSDGPAVTSLGILDDTVGTHGSAAPTKGVQLGGHAASSLPSTVADGEYAKLLTDIYGALVLAGFQFASNAIRVINTNPLSEQHVESTLCDLTNIAQSTTDYCGYVDMDGYQAIGIQIVASGTPTDTITVTLECTLQDDTTAPESCAYFDVTDYYFGVASVVDDTAWWNPSQTIVAKYCRVKYVTSGGGGNDQDLTVFVKVLY